MVFEVLDPFSPMLVISISLDRVPKLHCYLEFKR